MNEPGAVGLQLGHYEHVIGSRAKARAKEASGLFRRSRVATILLDEVAVTLSTGGDFKLPV